MSIKYTKFIKYRKSIYRNSHRNNNKKEEMAHLSCKMILLLCLSMVGTTN